MVERRRLAAAVGLEVLHALRSADRGVADRRLVPRRRRDRLPVPRAGAGARARAVVAVHKGLGGPIPAASVGGRVATRHRPRRRGVPRRDLPRVPLGLRARPRRRGGRVRHRVDADAASTDWSRAWPRAGVAPGANVYAELGSTWYLMLRRPVEAAHVLGKLLRAVGPERIVWGTDSIWYGSPQPLIDAFRTFTIPERMQEEFGYPPLTAETKAKILGVNARSVYGITDDDVARARADHDRNWVESLRRGSPPRSPRRLRPDRLRRGSPVQHAVGEAVLAAPGLSTSSRSSASV